jgi:hypothetical protein
MVKVVVADYNLVRRSSVEIGQQAAFLVLMFILRFGVPLAITLGVGYWLRRLDKKWQAEAASRQATVLAQREIERQPRAGSVAPPKKPCWEVHQCPTAARDCCPAFLNSRVPCWMARYLSGGRLPAKCYGCVLFNPRRRRLIEKGHSL